MAQFETPSEGPIASINITPFVDVVLVLLVIFMVTAPMIAKESLKINLPNSDSTDGKLPKTVGIAVTKEGSFLVEGKAVDDQTVIALAKNAIKENPDIQAIIAADQDSKHAHLVKAIDLIKQGGLHKFALQIKPNVP